MQLNPLELDDLLGCILSSVWTSKNFLPILLVNKQWLRVAYKAIPKEWKGFALMKCCQDGKTACVVRLLKEDIDVGFGNNNPLKLASANGHLDIIKMLLSDNRVKPNENGCSALWEACNHGYVEIVREFLKHPEVRPTLECLETACLMEHKAVILELLKDGRVNPHRLDYYPLKIACSVGKMDIAKMLVEDAVPNKVQRDESQSDTSTKSEYIFALKDLLDSKIFKGDLGFIVMCMEVEKPSPDIQTLKLLLQDPNVICRVDIE